MKTACFVLGVGLLMSSHAQAQSGFYLPTSTSSSGQDEFRAADGTTCRTTMDGTKRVEVGTYSTVGQNPVYGYGYGYNYSTSSSPRSLQGNVGVYGRVSVSLDAMPDRMDCNKLFELELEKRRLEVEIMKRSLLAADRELDQQKRSASAAPSDRQADGPREGRSRKPDGRLAQEDGRTERPNRAQAKSVSQARMPPL